MSIIKKIVIGYSKSLFQTVNNLEIDEKTKEFFNFFIIKNKNNKIFLPNVYIVGEELYIISYTIKNLVKLENFIKNPIYHKKQKLNLLFCIFPGLTIITKSFLKILADRNHLELILEISENYNNFLLKLRKSTNVKLIVANTLKEHSGNLLLSMLKKLTSSTEVILKVSYNSNLLGGLVLEYNSITIDVSFLKKFNFFL
jgi:ATP synthase F1 delta subunit